MDHAPTGHRAIGDADDALRVRHIVLIGAMGAGKSTVGVEVAPRLDRIFVDSDVVIREQAGRTARQIAADEGVAALHALEQQILMEALGGETPAVVAAAASVVDSDAVVAALRDHRCVWLWAGDAVLASRQPGEAHRRTIGDAEVDRLARRTARYRSLASLVIDTGSVGIEEAVAQIVARGGAGR